MIDLVPLRPRDSSPPAIAAAIARCTAAGRGALAEIERLKAARAGLLLRDDAAQLEGNLTQLVAAMRDATLIGEMLDQLQQSTKPNAPDPTAEIRGATIAAAASVTAWWAQHGPIVLDGVRVLVAASSTILAAAKAAPPPPAPSNVASFPTRPVA